MSQRNEVVVGCDGSEQGWAALDWALPYAAERRASIAVLSAVVSLSVEDSVGGLMEERVEHAENVVAEALRRCTSAGVEARGDVSTLPAGRSLVEASEDAVALVVGATGYGAVTGVLWGSVSRHVIRHAAVPTVVVRERADAAARKVVIGVDGTPIGDEALRFGLDIASRRGWDVEVLHAADAPGSWKSWTEKVSEREAERQAAVERMLSELTAGWQEKYPDVALESAVARLEPGDALRDASSVAALVVVGAHGRRGVSGHLGSVSQAVARQAHCPVAVLHLTDSA